VLPYIQSEASCFGTLSGGLDWRAAFYAVHDERTMGTLLRVLRSTRDVWGDKLFMTRAELVPHAGGPVSMSS
jgi:hypothetical protein